ncbi:hypothetical protein EJ110_NYTH10281 [Nymphaea thermarum]|nr:hypothetical protein EJ110_NYTH10281 [Nymphaea thermarum]
MVAEAKHYKIARCKGGKKQRSRCPASYYKCPAACPHHCQFDCASCKPVCRCDKPGAVCQDPRFIGGDGITFYFHGKKDSDFCLLSDSNLHINAHFIGKRGQGMKRDFTWVQSIVLLYGSHQVYIGATKASSWVDSVDHLRVLFDGAPVELPTHEGAKWTGPELTSITRTHDTNALAIEVPEHFSVTAHVVPVTKSDSHIHKYGIGDDDCFAHLDLGFKFYSLSPDVDGVLGQTYRDGYRSPVKIGASMPIMGGDRKYSTTDIFAANCAVVRFGGSSTGEVMRMNNLGSAMSCTSGLSGRSLVCKR